MILLNKGNLTPVIVLTDMQDDDYSLVKDYEGTLLGKLTKDDGSTSNWFTFENDYKLKLFLNSVYSPKVH